MNNLSLIFKSLILSCILISSANATTVKGPFATNSGNWNTINNGGFESGLSGWGLVGGHRGNGSVVTQPVIFGASSLALNPGNFNGPGYAIRQSVAVTAGKEYVLSGFFNTRNLIDSNIYIDLNDTSFDVHVYPERGELESNNEEWLFSWLAFTPTTNSVLVRVVQDGKVTSSETAYFDEIAVTLASDFVPVSSVPVPTAVWLFTSGLVTLFSIRRKA